MKQIKVPKIEDLSPESQEILGKLKKKLGSVPNLYATFGYSASALKGILDFDAELSVNPSFTAKEREAINLIVSQVNNCEYCLAAHTALAKLRGFTEEETILIRKGTYPEPKLNTAILLAKSILINKGEAEQSFLDNFFDAGYDEKALIELIGSITVRSFTNYVFACTKIPIDFPIAKPLS
ncbi:MAG: carboxymuconolactone decarboxylase family protein [Chitinophagaceae bacterium]